MEIKTNHKVGDTVYWVHGTNKLMIYKGTIEEISLCEYQGALYCLLHSPTFKINPYPNVHYSHVFHTREQAEEFREAVKAAKGNESLYPVCYGCRYAWKGRGV